MKVCFLLKTCFMLSLKISRPFFQKILKQNKEQVKARIKLFTLRPCDVSLTSAVHIGQSGRDFHCFFPYCLLIHVRKIIGVIWTELDYNPYNNKEFTLTHFVL